MSLGYWSYLLASLGMVGIWLMGSRPKVGYWFNIVGQSVWMAYGVTTRQWGFVFQATVYALLFSRLLWLTHYPRGSTPDPYMREEAR